MNQILPGLDAKLAGLARQFLLDEFGYLDLTLMGRLYQDMFTRVRRAWEAAAQRLSPGDPAQSGLAKASRQALDY